MYMYRCFDFFTIESLMLSVMCSFYRFLPVFRKCSGMSHAANGGGQERSSGRRQRFARMHLCHPWRGNAAGTDSIGGSIACTLSVSTSGPPALSVSTSGPPALSVSLFNKI